MIISWDNFWQRVKKEDSCWIWIGVRTCKGYGTFSVKGKHYRAHRLSYTMHIGEIPSRVLVCHKCDNPSCVNPDHLFLGTPLTNMQDKMTKGRWQGPRRALSSEKELEIAERWKPYQNTSQLAEEFGVTNRMISKIGNRYGKKRGLTGFNSRKGARWSKA